MNGLKAATRGMDKMLDATKNIAAQMSRRLIALKAGLEAIKGVVRNVAAQIPEIGMAFNVAKEVFLKNLLWPLRQMLVPMLQKMLDWVTSHRTLFVKWGQTLANVFRALLSVGKQVWEILKKVGNAFGSVFRQITGGGLENFLNLITVKLAAAFIFLSNLLSSLAQNLHLAEIWEKLKGVASAVWDFVSGLFKANDQGNSLLTVFNTIADIVGKVVLIGLDFLKPLIEGIKKSDLKNAVTPLQNIANAIKGLVTQIKAFVEMPEVQKFIKLFGQLFGNEVQLILINFSSAIEAVVDALQWLVYGIRAIIELAKGTSTKDIGEMAANLAKEQALRWTRIGESYKSVLANEAAAIKGVFGGVGQKPLPKSVAPEPVLTEEEQIRYGKLLSGAAKNVDDVIITKRGEVIRTDPNDTIYARKSGASMALGNQNITINLNVTEGSARQAGENFSYGLQQGFRRALLDAHLAGGG